MRHRHALRFHGRCAGSHIRLHGSSRRLHSRVGLHVLGAAGRGEIARDLFLTGRILDAAEAKAIGLVTKIVPREELLTAARELAATLMANSPGALAGDETAARARERTGNGSPHRTGHRGKRGHSRHR